MRRAPSRTDDPQRAVARLREAGDQGFTLIEVVVALALLAVLSAAVLATVQDSLGLTRTNEARVTASGLAGRVMEAARMAVLTAPLPAAEQVTSGGVRYTVTRTVESVQQAGSAGRCGVSPSRTAAQRLHVAVDWPNRPPGVPPVRLSSLRTVDINAVAPDAGTLYAVVENGDGAGVGGVTVTATRSGATATTTTTDTNGCAVFPSLAPGDYQVTISRAGYSDPSGVIQPTRGPVTLTRGAVAEELFVYSPYTPESPAGGFTVTSGCSRGPVPAFRARSTALNSTGATAITLTRPAAAVPGDLLLAHLAFPAGPAEATISVPAGWTRVAYAGSGTSLAQGLWYRVVTAADPSTSTWGYPQQRALGGLLAYSGVDTVKPVDVVAGQRTASDRPQSTPSVTTTVVNTRLVALFSAERASVYTPPAGMVEQYDVAITDVVGASAADQAFPSTGATGTRTATIDRTEAGVAHLLALAPASSASAALSWTATTWPSADGYYLRREVNGLLQRDWTVAGRTTTSSTDGPLVNGTSYTYTLAATAGSVETDPVTATFTPTC